VVISWYIPVVGCLTTIPVFSTLSGLGPTNWGGQGGAQELLEFTPAGRPPASMATWQATQIDLQVDRAKLSNIYGMLWVAFTRQAIENSSAITTQDGVDHLLVMKREYSPIREKQRLYVLYTRVTSM
jgi:hypothetical protein